MYDNKFCIILDDYRDQYPDYWAITTAKDTLAEAQAEDSYDTEPDQVPRSAYRGEPKGETFLVFAPNPEYGKKHGSIYLLQRV